MADWELAFYSACSRRRRNTKMSEETKAKIIATRRKNKFGTHRKKLDALRIHDIMVRLVRGDFN